MELRVMNGSTAPVASCLNLPNREECVYTSCFCEENVWKLCEYVKKSFPGQLHNCFAVFISNYRQSVPLWCQRAGDAENGFVIWDYHVIFVIKTEPCQVYDLDTTLTFPCSFELYSKRTFRDEKMMNVDYHRMFRVIPAKVFLDNFSSDRSHMVDKTGTWTKSPPKYPCIQISSITSNLHDFVNVDPTVGVGEILTLNQFIQRFQATASN